MHYDGDKLKLDFKKEVIKTIARGNRLSDEVRVTPKTLPPRIPELHDSVTVWY
jgi:hypothetical protein